MTDLSGRVAFITGAASGIGRATALMFAASGARVIVSDISPEGAAVAEDIGGSAIHVTHDVTSEESWRAALAEAEKAFGPVNVLVNNAGAFVTGKLVDATAEQFDTVTHVNQLGVLLGMKCVADAMTRAGGGVIINMSSLAGMRGAPRQLIYVGSKWAVRGMTKTAVAELAPLNIRVNSVHPGPVDTPLLKVNPPAFNEAMAKATPMKRLAQPEDIAKAIRFLASDDAAFINGAELSVDGGLGAV